MEGRRNLRGRFAESRRARGAKLIGAAVAPKRANGRDSVPARGQDVMLAIAPHPAIAGIEPLTLEDVSNQVGLVLEAAAKLVAISRLEVMLEAEVAKNPLRVDKGLRRAKEEARSRGPQIGKRLLHAVVDDSFEKTFARVPTAIELERNLRIAFTAQSLGETSAQRGPDDPVQFGGRRRTSSQRFERKAETADDALGRISQRSVQIDQKRTSPIGFRRRCCRIVRRFGCLLLRRRSPTGLGGDMGR